jgi:hypothetical protein
MQFNLSLHNNSGVRRRQKINPKNNNNNNEKTKTQNPTPATEKKPQRKPKFPCLICGDDHFTRDYPHRDKVVKLLKGIPNPSC